MSIELSDREVLTIKICLEAYMAMLKAEGMLTIADSIKVYIKLLEPTKGGSDG